MIVVPILCGWLAVRATKAYYVQPDGVLRTIVWCVQALVVATIASYVVSLAASQLTPLTTLLKMTLIFPDNAPSRFGVALRAGTIGRLRKRELDVEGSLQSSAVRAIELVMALGLHERSTRGHVERVRAYADLIGQQLGLDDDQLNKLRWGVLLHDIGKLRVPPEILNKETALTHTEWRVLQAHPTAGGEILEPLLPWLGEWGTTAAQHHERWDGTGYPAGLHGEEISLAARITAVADSVDVITSKRSYKSAQSIKAARSELVACSGTQFDPQIVRAFLQVGLQDPRRFGVFSWLLELPPFIRLVSNMVTATAVVAVAAAGLASGPATTLAFADHTSSVAGAVAHTPDWVDPQAGIPADEERGDGLSGEVTDSTEPAPIPPVDDTAPTTAPTPEPAPSAPPQSGAPPSTVASQSAAPPPTTVAPQSAAPPPTTVAPQSTAPPPTTVAPPPVTAAPTTPAPPTTAPTTTPNTDPPSTDPTGSGILALGVEQLPPSLDEDQLASDDHIFVFQERTRLLLSAPLTVQSFDQGVTINGASNRTTELAVGTPICVWFIHIDFVSDGGIDAVVDFGQPILGYALNDARLTASAQFELPSLNYSYRGSGRPDEVTTAGSQMVIRAEVLEGDIDQMRVFTSC